MLQHLFLKPIIHNVSLDTCFIAYLSWKYTLWKENIWADEAVACSSWSCARKQKVLIFFLSKVMN